MPHINIAIWGPPASGKTFAREIIVDALNEAGFDVRYFEDEGAHQCDSDATVPAADGGEHAATIWVGAAPPGADA